MVPLLWALGMVPGVGAAAANPIQDLAALRTTVYTFLRVHAQNLYGRTEVTVGNIDSRLRLARCDAPLEAFLPSGDMHAGTITVGVRCPGTRPWRLYVSGRIRLYRPVVVLRRALVRGAVLSSGDLRRETRDVSSLHAAFLSDPARAVGLRLRRRAVAGALLRASWLAAPTLVHQGQRVILLAKSEGSRSAPLARHWPMARSASASRCAICAPSASWKAWSVPVAPSWYRCEGGRGLRVRVPGSRIKVQRLKTAAPHALNPEPWLKRVPGSRFKVQRLKMATPHAVNPEPLNL